MFYTSTPTIQSAPLDSLDSNVVLLLCTFQRRLYQPSAGFQHRPYEQHVGRPLWGRCQVDVACNRPVASSHHPIRASAPGSNGLLWLSYHCSAPAGIPGRRTVIFLTLSCRDLMASGYLPRLYVVRVSGCSYPLQSGGAPCSCLQRGPVQRYGV